MIVHISSIAIPDTTVNDYLEYVHRNLIPRYEAALGLASVHLLQRQLLAYVEVITISVWDSDAALKNFFRDCPVDDVQNQSAGIEFEPRTYVLLTSRQGQQHQDCTE